MTIRRKLLLWYTTVFTVSAIALMVALYLFTAHQMHREVETFLLDECEEWAAMCRKTLPDLPALERIMREEIAFEKRFPMVYRLYDARTRRELLYIGPGSWREAIREQTGFADPKGAKAYASLRVGRHGRLLRLLAIRVDDGNGSRLVLQGGVYVRRLEIRLLRLRVFLAASVLASVVLALAGGAFLAGRSLKPVDDIVDDLDRIEAGNLSARVVVSRREDEADRLRRGINRMLDRIEDSFERMQRFTADAAHEFRTPLAALQCRLDVALTKAREPEEYRRVLSDVLEDAESLARTVNELLLLTRIDANAEHPDFRPVPLGPLLDDLREVFGVAAEERDIELTVDCAEACVVLGDGGLLRKLFGNLMDNAVRLNPSGGRVSLSAAREGDACVVRVTDTGTGIPPDLQERIFDRFFRADDSRSRAGGHVGLGLSICRSIAELHGGAISVHSSRGEGSTFEARLPAAP